MDTQRPPVRPVEQSLEIIEELHNEWVRRKAISEARERTFWYGRANMQRYFQRLLAKVRGQDTGELQQCQASQVELSPSGYDTAIMPAQTTDGLPEIRREPKKPTHIDEMPTTLLAPPRGWQHASTEQVNLPQVDSILPDTGTTDLRAIRLLQQTSQPIETTYVSDEPLILLIRNAVKKHEAEKRAAVYLIEMPQSIYDLLTIIDMTEYVTAERHIPFAINDTIPVDTMFHTIKCISY